MYTYAPAVDYLELRIHCLGLREKRRFQKKVNDDPPWIHLYKPRLKLQK